MTAPNSAGVASAEGGPDTGYSTGTPPTLVSGSFDDDYAPATVSFTFSEPIQMLDTSNLTVSNLDGGAAPTVVGYTYANQIGTFTLSGQLADAHFRATLNGVKDTYGNALSGDNALNFSFLRGDANRDGTVNSSDFAALAGNFGSTGNLKFSQGDFNYDGVVNALDFNALATRYGESILPPGSSLTTDPAAPATPAAALPAAATPTASLFSNQPVKPNVLDLMGKPDNGVLTQSPQNRYILPSSGEKFLIYPATTDARRRR